MKKIIVIAAFVLFGIGTSFAQNQFKIGFNGAIPVGDAGDVYNAGIAADAAYLFEVANRVWVGPQVTYFQYFVDESINEDKLLDDTRFLPIAASSRIGLGEAFYLGADLGYAIGLEEGNKGGFYYRPKAGYTFGAVGLTASYSGVSTDGNIFSSIIFGVELGF
jgi:hypothetical protein|tara:strand:- start:57194 stop:57682 length:489 start_codon:yes stop_codon:yes gene_type:complete